MTVCVAAIGAFGQTLILASDRMITALAQYQAPDPKVFPLTTSIAVMWSGSDVSFQRIIHNRLRANINAKVKADPGTWLTVEETAYLYQHHYNEARRQLMEQAVLQPFGLDTASFLKSQSAIGERLAERLANEMGAFSAPQISALIVGMDSVGPSMDDTSVAHIYKFENWSGAGVISCEDAIGFGAIGSGAIHATSELMKSGHGPSRSGDQTLSATYLAKKRGQAGPGVGEETDFFYFHPRPPHPAYLAPVGADICHVLKEGYGRLIGAESRATDRVQKALNERLRARQAPEQPVGQASMVATAPAKMVGGVSKTTEDAT